MRFLVLGPRYEDSFVDNVASALTEMGHEVIGNEEVRHAEYWSLPNRLVRALKERIFGDAPLPADRKLLDLVRQTRPDVLLALTWDVHPQILAELGKTLRGRRILWWGDCPANSQRWGLVNPHWDTVYVKDPDAAQKLRLVGQNAHLMHEAMNPKWHRPVATRKNDSVIIAGNYYGFRQALLVRLARDNVDLALYGSPLPHWAAPEVRARFSGKYITRTEKSRIFGEGMACLNSFALAEGNSINCRAFEIAGAGGLQIVERRPTLSQCFEPGREVMDFGTYEELLAHIDKAKRFPAEVEPIREAGAKRALAEHTYRHRLEKILAAL
ncbi:MAG: glycosyltransferase [Polyangiaceae bacterium]|nr:glycosyltransferase [Polyangiaceae bacterium]